MNSRPRSPDSLIDQSLSLWIDGLHISPALLPSRDQIAARISAVLARNANFLSDDTLLLLRPKDLTNKDLLQLLARSNFFRERFAKLGVTLNEMLCVVSDDLVPLDTKFGLVQAVSMTPHNLTKIDLESTNGEVNPHDCAMSDVMKYYIRIYVKNGCQPLSEMMYVPYLMHHIAFRDTPPQELVQNLLLPDRGFSAEHKPMQVRYTGNAECDFTSQYAVSSFGHDSRRPGLYFPTPEYPDLPVAVFSYVNGSFFVQVKSIPSNRGATYGEATCMQARPWLPA